MQVEAQHSESETNVVVQLPVDFEPVLAAELQARLQAQASEIIDLRRQLEIEARARENSQATSALLQQTKEQLQQRTQSLDAALAKASALGEARSLFLANVSHELRTPLNGIIGMSELLLRTSLDDRQERLCRTIVDSGRALVTIINDILDFSKIESGKIEFRSIPFHLRRCIEDVVALLQVPAGAKGLSINLHGGPDLPEIVIGDAGRIRQVLTNLIGNAVKFTDKGRVDIVVTSRLTGEHADLTIAIQDTGPGIPEHKLGAIFEKFTQIDNTSTRGHEGTGLGLSICKQLVERMGGSIVAESTLGLGARFTACLSLSAPRQESLAIPAETLIAGKAVQIVQCGAIDATMQVQRLLEAGCRVCVADGWDDVDAWLASCDLMLIVCPAVDTEELRQIARLRGQVGFAKPIVMAAGLGSIGDGATLEKIGVQGYMTSAVAPETRLQILGHVFRDESLGVRRLVTHHVVSETALASAGMGGPRKVVAPAGAPHAIAKPPVAAGPGQAGARRALVVDDSLVNQAVAADFLVDMGWSVAIAANGREAVEMVAAETFQVILMDCQMPVMDGFEATRLIRRAEDAGSRAGMPIIALTANAFSKDREKCLSAGMDEFLAKPLDPDLLQEVIERATTATRDLQKQVA